MPESNPNRKKVLVFLQLLATPDALAPLRDARDPEQTAVELCRLWIEDVYVPGIRNLEGLKADRDPQEVETFESEFSEGERELLYQFHRFLELRLEMLPKRLPEERSFPDGDFWQNIFRHARNVLDEIDPERLEVEGIVSTNVMLDRLRQFLPTKSD